MVALLLFHTNTVEGYFSLFKRGMKDVYQHCSERHLHRYLAEFEFSGIDSASRVVDPKTSGPELIAWGRSAPLLWRPRI